MDVGQQQAAVLLQEVPEMAALGPIAAAFVGFSSLAMRQGWGAVVAFANGVWQVRCRSGLRAPSTPSSGWSGRCGTG